MERHINGANIFKKKILLLQPYYKTLLMHALYFLDKVYKLTIFYIYACSRADIITHSALQTRAHSTFTEIIC